MKGFESDLNSLLRSLCETARVPGYVAGIYHQGMQIEAACGIANLNTGAAMTTDTRWLLGSVSKVMTAHLLLRYVERGQVELDAPVLRYLPDFRLSEPGAAERISVRQLLNHSNGIDADALMPGQDFGPGAVKSYVDTLARCGTLFAPGEMLHYSNPGFCLAARIVEVISGQTYHHALEQELFTPMGMQHACTSVEQTVLQRVAIGSFVDANTGCSKPTRRFMLPASGAGAGATQIVTIGDVLAFARTHLHGGMAPNGKRVLATELAALMQTPSFDLNTPNASPVGLGWWPVPAAGTTALFHGGSTPGGSSSLTIFPELDLIVAGYGNCGTAGTASVIHNAVIALALERYAGRSIAPLLTREPVTGVSACAGAYTAFQTRTRFSPDGDGLEQTSEFRPFDDEHLHFLADCVGVEPRLATMQPAGAVAFEPLRERLFIPRGRTVESLSGVWGRGALLSFHGDDGNGRPLYCHQNMRCARRETAA